MMGAHHMMRTTGARTFSIAFLWAAFSGGCGRATSEDESAGSSEPTVESVFEELGLPPCETLPGENVGADVGEWAVRGQVLTAEGIPVAGVPIRLSGDEQASHLTNLFGTYTLRLDGGAYALEAGEAACQVTPAVIALNELSGPVQQDFEALGEECTQAKQHSIVETGRVIDVANLTSVATNVLQEGSLEGVRKRLELILDQEVRLNESGAPACALTIAGHPAFEQRALITQSGPQGAGQTTFWSLSTVIAYPDRVLQFTSLFGSDAPDEFLQRSFVLVRNLSAEDFAILTAP
jgi:hypothetical protein